MEINDQSTQLDLLNEISQDIFFHYDLKTNSLFIAPNIAKKLGLREVYCPMPDAFINEHIFEEDKSKIINFFNGQNVNSIKFRLKTKNQNIIWYTGTLKKTSNYNNYLTGYFRDITHEVEFKIEEEKLKMLNIIQNLMLMVPNESSKNRFKFLDYLKMFLEAEQVFIALYDPNLKMEYSSGENKFNDGSSIEEMLFLLDKKYLKHNHCAQVIYDLEDFSDIHSFVEIPFLGKDGSNIGILGIVNAKKEKINIKILNVISSSLSLTMQNYLYNKELETFGMFDMLTKVKNRNSYEKYVNDFILTQVNSLGVIVIDINGLKTCNDTAGHFAGDLLICDVAHHLSEVFGNENVYRFGGDEFIVICENISEELLKNKIDCFLTSSSSLSVSLGYSYASNNINIVEMQNIADKKMYLAKKEFYKNNLEINSRKN